MTPNVQPLPANPLEEYWPEKTMGEVRDKTLRTLRDERQRGDGPPWVKDGRHIYYHVPGYREWLRTRLKQPVRSGRAT
jgi:hypothetical protein